MELRNGANHSTVAPGPANNLKAAATSLGYKLSNNLTLSRDGEEDIPLIGQDPRWIDGKIRDAICDTLIAQLGERCKPENNDKKNHRDDFEGIPPKIDHETTKALLNWKNQGGA